MSGGPRTTPQLLGDARFGPYVVGQWLGNTGNWFHNVAASIAVFALTGSSTLVGVVGGLQFAAMLLLSPWAGGLGDRVDRRRLLLAGQLIGLAGAVGIAVAALTVGLEAAGGVWAVVVATAVIGVGYAVSVPTIQAYVPSLVPPGDLPQAIALNSVTFNLARAIGPGAAGALVAAVGVGWAFGVNALSFAVFAGVLVWLGQPMRRSATPSGSSAASEDRAPTAEGMPAPGGDPGGPSAPGDDRSVRAGLRLARRDPRIGVLLLATAAVGVASDPIITLAPALAERTGQGEWVVGAIGSAFGGGATLSALLTRRLRDRLGARRLALAGLVAVAVGIAAGGSAVGVGPLLLAMAVAGAGFIQAVSQLNTALQLQVDDAVRGRMMALWSVAFLGVRPVAAAVDGALADLAGLPVAMAAVGGVAALGAVLLWRRPDAVGG